MLQDSKTSGLQVTGAFVLQDSWALGLQGAKVLGFLESRASVLHVSTASCFQGSKASGLQSTPKILKVFKSFKAICLERKAPQSRFGQIQSSRPPNFQDSRIQESKTSGSRSPGLPYPELLGCRAPGSQGFRIPGSRPSRLHVSTAPCLRGSRTSGRQAKRREQSRSFGNSFFFWIKIAPCFHTQDS